MRKSRSTEPQIMAVLRQAGSGVAVPELCRDCSEQRDQHGELLQVAVEVWRHGCVDDEPERAVNATGPREPRNALEDENRRLKRMFADLSMRADLLKEALGGK